MVKYQFGKNWSWCEDIKKSDQITSKHLDIVYRLDANRCQPGKCKINCNTNPYCLNGLGEKKLTNLLQKDTNIIVERNEYFRDEEEYAGLVNLGATCYINTYLQVWYNNPIFRDYILNAEFDEGSIEGLSDSENGLSALVIAGEVSKAEKEEKLPELKLKPSKSITFNLQLIFNLLKKSIRKSIDPNFFIKALGLDENMQQDAQEFCQLFLTILENKLPRRQSGEDVIKHLFEGQYSYITECSTCKRESARKSSFLELSLNIQNCGTLFECIDDMLKEEIMDGDNQYYCDNCMSKTNAKRFTKLNDLPPVLNLQLLRFVYDRNSAVKKKLSSKIKFPEILDLSEYKTEPMCMDTDPVSASSSVYQLGAILMHVGKSAYSGHYMAQIKNFESNEWFSFNDESINKIKKKQQLGCTEEEIEKQKTATTAAASSSKQHTTNGGADHGSELPESQQTQSQTPGTKSKTFSTSNAYLLVYYRKDLISSASFTKKASESGTSVVSKTSRIVDNDNSELEKWFEEMKITKIDRKETQNTELTMIRSIYDSLWCNSNTSVTQMYFINIDFIKKLLSNQTMITTITPESTSKYLCTHKRLNPFAVNRFKVINEEGLKSILTNYALKSSEIGAYKVEDRETTLCLQCVTNIFEYLKLKDRLKDGSKLLRSLLRTDEIDIESLKPNGHNGAVNDHGNEVCVLTENESDYESSKRWYWVGKESIRLWTSLALKKVSLQLPPVKFTNEIEVIDLTSSNGSSANFVGEQAENAMQSENSSSDNSNDKAATTSSQHVNNNNTENDPDFTQLTFSFNEEIVCNHGGLSTTPNKRLVSSEIFKLFHSYFPNMREFSSTDLECRKCKMHNEEYLIKTNEVKSQKEMLIDVFNNKNRPSISDSPNETVLYIVMLDFIKEWKSMIKNSKYKSIEIMNNIMLCEHQKLPFNEKNVDHTLGYLVTSNEWNFISKNYKFDQEISIQKVDADTIIFDPDVCETCLQQNEINKVLYENKKILIRQRDDDDVVETTAPDGNNDCEIISNPKKIKLSDCDDFTNGAHTGGNAASPASQKSTLSGNLRRSKRSRKCKGDMEVLGSSYSTVKDIKLQIAGQTHKLLSEQHLFFNGVELENDKTLIDCKISPGDVLILKLDQVTNDDFDSTNYELAHLPEIGFKGTNLYG